MDKKGMFIDNAELRPYEPTLRDRAAYKIAGGLEKLGLGDYYALDTARDLVGRPNADSILGSLGVLDFTPAGVVFAGDESFRDYSVAEKPTDYIAPTVGLALSTLEAYPLTKAITKPVGSFLSSLMNKAADTPVDMTRRNVATGIAVSPIGALAVTGQVAPPIAKDFTVLGSQRIKDLMSDVGDDALNVIEKSDIDAMLKELKQTNPNATIDDLADLADSEFMGGADIIKDAAKGSD